MESITTEPHEHVMSGDAACLTCCYWHRLTTKERAGGPLAPPGSLKKDGECRIKPKPYPTDKSHWCGKYSPDKDAASRRQSLQLTDDHLRRLALRRSQSGDAGIDLDEEREQVGAIQARVETAEVIAVCWNTIILITF